MKTFTKTQIDALRTAWQPIHNTVNARRKAAIMIERSAPSKEWLQQVATAKINVLSEIAVQMLNIGSLVVDEKVKWFVPETNDEDKES